MKNQVRQKRRGRTAVSPYTKYSKRPYKYNQTPLHKEGKGIPTTAKNIREFDERLGIKKTSKFMDLASVILGE